MCSRWNMMQYGEVGHKIVVLANLQPAQSVNQVGNNRNYYFGAFIVMYC